MSKNAPSCDLVKFCFVFVLHSQVHPKQPHLSALNRHYYNLLRLLQSIAYCRLIASHFRLRIKLCRWKFTYVSRYSVMSYIEVQAFIGLNFHLHNFHLPKTFASIRTSSKFIYTSKDPNKFIYAARDLQEGASLTRVDQGQFEIKIFRISTSPSSHPFKEG